MEREQEFWIVLQLLPNYLQIQYIEMYYLFDIVQHIVYIVSQNSLYN